MQLKRSIVPALVALVTTLLLVVYTAQETPKTVPTVEVSVTTPVVEPVVVAKQEVAEAKPAVKETKREEELPSRGSERGNKLRVQITAYTAFEPGQTSGTGLAYDGRPAIGYHTIAVDPKVIPLGSKVYVPGLGWFLAHDTGSAIKGNKVDVCLNTEDEANNWGRRTLEVTVIPPTEKFKMNW